MCPGILVGTSQPKYSTSPTNLNYSNSNYNLAPFIFTKIQVRYLDFILVDLPNLHSFSVYYFWVCLSQGSSREGRMLFKKPVFGWKVLVARVPIKIVGPGVIAEVRKSTVSLLRISSQYRLCFLRF